MTDYMLTVLGGLGARDVQINNANGMRDAIAIAEKRTGCPVDHGRAGILSDWDPAIVIDAETGEMITRHDKVAHRSMTIVNVFRERMMVPRGT